MKDDPLISQIRQLPEAQRDVVAKALLSAGLEEAGEAVTVTSGTAGSVTSISRGQMQGLFVATAIPMVGFGFVDNSESISCRLLLGPRSTQRSVK